MSTLTILRSRINPESLGALVRGHESALAHRDAGQRVTLADPGSRDGVGETLSVMFCGRRLGWSTKNAEIGELVNVSKHVKEPTVACEKCATGWSSYEAPTIVESIELAAGTLRAGDLVRTNGESRLERVLRIESGDYPVVVDLMIAHYGNGEVRQAALPADSVDAILPADTFVPCDQGPHRHCGLAYGHEDACKSPRTIAHEQLEAELAQLPAHVAALRRVLAYVTDATDSADLLAAAALVEQHYLAAGAR